MDSASVYPQMKQRAAFPQRRGQIKAQIFGSFFETVSSVASKTGDALSSRLRGTVAGGEGSDGLGSPVSAATLACPTPSPSPSQSPASDSFPIT